MKNVNWSKLLKVLKPNPAHSSWLAAQKHFLVMPALVLM